MTNTRNFHDGRAEYTVGGLRWWLDPRQLIDRSILSHGLWEPATSVAFFKLVRPGMTVLDVGANIGYYTIHAARLVGPTGRVIALEPMPDARKVIERNVALNCYEKIVDVWGTALDEQNGALDLFFNYSWSKDGPEVKQQGTRVPVSKLDDLLVGPNAVASLDVVKIDVDGYEYRLLLGGVATLRTMRPALVLEVCDYTLRWAANLSKIDRYAHEYGEQVRAMLGLLDELEYDLFDEATFAPTTADALLAGTDLSQYSVNIVALHR